MPAVRGEALATPRRAPPVLHGRARPLPKIIALDPKGSLGNENRAARIVTPDP